jgi:hypothetical protein
LLGRDWRWRLAAGLTESAALAVRNTASKNNLVGYGGIREEVQFERDDAFPRPWLSRFRVYCPNPVFRLQAVDLGRQTLSGNSVAGNRAVCQKRRRSGISKPYISNMKLKNLFASTLAACLLLGASLASAAEAKTYQVTGPVLEITPTVITVQKGDEKWQIARNKDTKVTGDLKVGSKVTIYYRMIGVEVEVKK